MKEAAGEANMTVITIILIGVIAAIAIPLVTNLMSNTAERTCCTEAGGVWKSNACTSGGGNAYDASYYQSCVSKAKGTNGN